MGVLNKCALRFSAPFWDTAVDWIEQIVAAPFGTTGYGQWVTWFSFTRSAGDYISLALTSGDFSIALENSTDAAIVASAMTALRSTYGSSVPNPISSVVTRWASDPWSYGSYSYLQSRKHTDASGGPSSDC